MSLRQFTFCPAWSSQEIRVLRRRELFGFWNKKQCSAPLNFFILAEPCWVPIVYWVCQRMYNDHCVRKKKKRCSSRLSFFLRFPVLTWNVLSCVLQLCKCMVCTWCHTIMIIRGWAVTVMWVALAHQTNRSVFSSSTAVQLTAVISSLLPVDI